MKINRVGTESRDLAIAGMSYVAKVIRSTMGPFGLNVALEKQNKITNDGFLISNELCGSLENEFERRGALIAQEASGKTNDQVGDATSTAWALTEAIVKEAVKYLPDDKRVTKAKKTPAEVIQLINKSKEQVVKELEQSAVPVTSQEDLIKSALVSVEDEEIATLLGQTQWELGPEGIIIAEEVNDTKSSIERVRGIRIDNGFGTSMVINNPEKSSLELLDMSIFLTNYVMDVKDLMVLKDKVFGPLINQKKLGIIIIARAFTSEAIKTCMESLKTGFAIFPVNAPYTNQTQVMKDMEAVVGGKHIDVEETQLEDIDISDVGWAKRFMARQHDAVITGEDNERSQERTQKRVEELKLALSGSESDFGKRMIESRIAQLSNGFAILKVGSPSTTNRKRLKDKCDDAVNSVRLALKGGTVKGAGRAFKEISDSLPDDNILKRPLTCIYDQIVNSAPEGWEIPEWVRDPMLTLKASLTNACDVSGAFASINGLVVEENPKRCKHED